MRRSVSPPSDIFVAVLATRCKVHPELLWAPLRRHFMAQQTGFEAGHGPPQGRNRPCYMFEAALGRGQSRMGARRSPNRHPTDGTYRHRRRNDGCTAGRTAEATGLKPSYFFDNGLAEGIT